MNRQNNLKIILTTVIVLVISAITVFTVVNWADIVKKFQSAASKNDGYEKHERNTVQPSNVDTNATIVDSSKDSASIPDETKILHHPTESNTKSFSKFDEPLNPQPKEATPIGLDDLPPQKEKEPINSAKFKANENSPLLADTSLDAIRNSKPKKSIKTYRSKRHFHAKKHHKRYRHSLAKSHKANGLEKRVIFLEKKFGVKKPNGNKQASLANRIYRLEKIITQKKK
ncbi:MAG TPA: hypothetical protein PLX69_15165 [Leptospiraceae bacterium]|nr:hypothetical protein [Leptospiraceae bacterium]HRG75899.1 hypothetical protein [Leptospiraceae bacterium]